MWDFLWKFGAAYRRKEGFKPGSPLWVRDLESLLSNPCFLFFSINQQGFITVPALVTRVDQWERRAEPDRVFFRAADFLMAQPIEKVLFAKLGQIGTKIDLLIISAGNKSSRAVFVPDAWTLEITSQVASGDLRFVDAIHFLTTKPIQTVNLSAALDLLTPANQAVVTGDRSNACRS